MSGAVLSLRSYAGTRRFSAIHAIPVLAAGVVLVMLAVFESNFYRPDNLHVVMQQFAVLGLVTLGQLLVLLVGGIDLSVGAVMNASLIVIALMNQHHTNLLALSLLACVGLGAAVGLANGLLVSLRDLPPFAATLGMTACVQGAILVYTKGVPAGNIPHPCVPSHSTGSESSRTR
jgi:ribose transport system permease protein